jgi:hypothetical protein
MKRADEGETATGHLAAEADARRARLADNLDELSVRMRPSNLIDEAKERAWARVDAATDEWVSIGADLVSDMAGWLRGHRGVAIGSAATALLGAGLVWYLTRRDPVPLYAAYDMEDPLMTDSDETEGGLGRKAAGAWSKVKDDARDLGDRAGEGYYAARSKAAELSDEARERAVEAARVAREKAQHAADVAREKAHEAAEAARDAAEKARIAAGEAGVWARRQPQENPATVVLVALAAGALLGALLPAGDRRRA